MSPAERPLDAATIDHVALSVGDLETMVDFYSRLGFEEAGRADFAPAPVRSVVLRNPAGATVELVAHDGSEPTAPASDPIAAARRRGLFHFALRTASVDPVVAAAVEAGARLVAGPAETSNGDRRFAYLADPEGNLIELLVDVRVR